MPDREKVMKGLECCIVRDPDAKRNCVECPYNHEGIITNTPCANGLIADALDLLKEQEARVMTIGDVYRDHDRVVWIECREYKSLIIAQYRGQASWHNGRFGKWERFATMMFGDYMHSESDEYGKTWRCWTSRPSPEQMRDTPWKGEKDD